MSIRVRALCQRSTATVTPATLRNGIAERLPALAAYYGEEGADAAVPRLRVDDAGGSVWSLSYGDAPGRSLRVERAASPDAVAAELGALRRQLEDCDEDGVDEVREELGRVVEIVGIELDVEGAEGLGWPVAIAAAACFAEHGQGLIQADEEGWMRPEGHGVDQVLDGD